jgi:drug/metabolite transporter (DMT)-like permease
MNSEAKHMGSSFRTVSVGALGVVSCFYLLIVISIPHLIPSSTVFVAFLIGIPALVILAIILNIIEWRCIKFGRTIEETVFWPAIGLVAALITALGFVAWVMGAATA